MKKIFILSVLIILLSSCYIITGKVDDGGLKGKESSVDIYFDKSDKKWKDQYGVCHTCTPENGFSLDGIEFDPGIKNSKNVGGCNGNEVTQCKLK